MGELKKSEQNVMEMSADQQDGHLSNRRKMIMGVFGITILYIIWGIVRVVS